MFAIIIFASMFERDLSRYSQSTQKTRLLTYSPSLWHKMTSNVIVALCAASNLPQATKVRECYENRVLWYLFRYLPTNPTSHHCDNIPANPSWITDIFRYHFRISTSSSTVELVYFIRILFETPLGNSRISHAPLFAKFNLIKITFRLDNKLINFYFTESLRPKI